MRITAFRKHRMSGAYWDFTTTTDSGGNPVKNYFFVEEIEFTMSTDTTPRLTFYTDYPLSAGGLLRSVVDSNGEEFMPGAQFVINFVQPQVSPLGLREGYKIRAAIV